MIDNEDKIKDEELSEFKFEEEFEFNNVKGFFEDKDSKPKKHSDKTKKK